MKQVLTVTIDGLEYIDEDGKHQYIDFRVCNKSWIQNHVSDRDEISSFDRKCVGWRKVDAEPPYIEFFTEPPTRFEFSIDEHDGKRDADINFYELRAQLSKARWTTIDLS